MGIALVAHSNAGAGGQNGIATTAAVDTTGATLLVMVLGQYNPNWTVDTVSDSKGNTWHGLTASVGNQARCVIWYAYDKGGLPLSVGAGHTVSGTGTSYAGVAFAAFSGTLTGADPFGQQNGGGGAVNSQATGSITPGQDNELIISGAANVSGAGFTVDSGLTIADGKVYTAAQSIGVSIAYIVQTNAAAVNPTWTNSGGNLSARVASFKAAALVNSALTRTLLGVGV